MAGGESPADQKRCEPGQILMGQAREKLVSPAVPDIPVGDGCVNAGTVHDQTPGAPAHIKRTANQPTPSASAKRPTPRKMICSLGYATCGLVCPSRGNCTESYNTFQAAAPMIKGNWRL